MTEARLSRAGAVTTTAYLSSSSPSSSSCPRSCPVLVLLRPGRAAGPGSQGRWPTPRCPVPAPRGGRTDQLRRPRTMQAVGARQTRGVGRRSGGSAVEGGRGPGGGTPGSRGPSRVCQETCERREESRQPHGCAGSSPGGMSPSPARPGRRLNRCQQTLCGQNTGPRPRRWRSLHLLPPPYSPCQTAAPKHLPFRCVLGDMPRALCVCGGVLEWGLPWDTT